MISGILYCYSKMSSVLDTKQPDKYKDFLGQYSKSILGARSYRDSLDVTERQFSEEKAAENYKAFLENRMKCSTVADAAFAKAQKARLINLPHMYDLHKRRLEKRPDVQALLKKSEDKINKDYFLTIFLREKLIKLGRINLDGIEPVLKGWKKRLLRIRLLF